MDRVTDLADPRRCQGAAPDGQCRNIAEHGRDYCRAHGGVSTALVEDTRLYRLMAVRDRKLAQLSSNDPVYALSEALTLVRMLVEKRTNLADQQPDLFKDHLIINTLMRTIERLSKSLTVIEERLKTLKGKSEVYRQGQLFIQACNEELADHPECLTEISNRIMRVIFSASNGTEVSENKLPVVPAQGERPPVGETMFVLNNPKDQQRLAELSRSSRLKSLTEDIGLQFMLIEDEWNECATDEVLVMRAAAINDHVKTLNKLVTSTLDIEEMLGNMLSDETQANIGQQVGRILVEEISSIENYEAIVDRIADRYGKAMQQARISQHRID